MVGMKQVAVGGCGQLNNVHNQEYRFTMHRKKDDKFQWPRGQKHSAFNWRFLHFLINFEYFDIYPNYSGFKNV